MPHNEMQGRPSHNLPAVTSSPGPSREGEATPVPHLPLTSSLWAIRRHRWKILTFVAACVISTVVISKRLTPIYESTATVDVDRDVPTRIVGQESRRDAMNDSDQFLATQIALIQSDSVLRPVSEQYHLREAERDAPDPVADPVLLHDAPVILKRLKVTRPPNTYLLRISYQSPDPWLAAAVANGVAKSYLDHTYSIRFRSSERLSSFMETQQDELKAKMERSSEALVRFERELNVINPEEKTSIISARVLQLNSEYTTAQADRVRKEALYNLTKSGSPNAIQVSGQSESLNRLIEKLNEAQQKFTATKLHYAANHPEYKRAAAQVVELEREISQMRVDVASRVRLEYESAVNREGILEKAVAQTKAEFDRLNARSFEYQELKREAEADKKLYAELIQKIREAGINAGFQSSSIRIADPARPALKPVFPRTGLNALLAFLLSSLLAISLAIVSDVASLSVRDPELVSKQLNTEVIGSLPTVRSLRSYSAATALNAGADSKWKDLISLRGSVRQNLRQYEESIQTLLNTVMLADFDRRLRSVMITSAAPFEGKSTVASHFAIAHARNGNRTLLIDGDLRRPSVQRVLGIEAGAGLADVLAAAVPWKDVLVKRPGLDNLDVLLAGTASLRTPELIGPQLSSLIEEAEGHYDLVVLDSPPVQGFPEPLRMATTVDGVMVVALAGRTSRKALAATLTALTRLRAHVLGLVLNQVSASTSETAYYAYYHSKDYYKA